MRHGAFAAAFGLALIGMARAEETSPPQTSAVPIPPGQIAAAIAALDGIAEATLTSTAIPGLAIAVVEGGEVKFAKGYGLREVGKPETVDADTVFQLASVSKSVGASVVAHQVGEGKVAWNSRMVDLLPGFALKDPAVTAMLTVGDLYSHRSGLPEYAGDDLEDLGFDRATILDRLRLLPLDAFRTSYAYTNFGLTAAAEGVATAAGLPWEELSEQVLYEPLGMTSTSSRFSDYMARANRAVPHVSVGDGWKPLHQRQPDPEAPAGGVSSSVHDLANWMKMMLADGSFDGAPIVAPEALLPAISPQSVSSPPFAPDARAGFYGFGFNVGVGPSGRVQLGHSGAFALGAATNFMLLPSADLGIVVLSNAAPIGAVESISLSFMDLAQFGKVTRDWFGTIGPMFAAMDAPFGALAGKTPPEAPAAAPPLAALAGTYSNAYFGPIEIAVAGDGLTLTAGPAKRSWPLSHWDGATFVYQPDGENATPGSVSSVSFDLTDKAARAVTIEFWNREGLGTFTR